MYTFDHDLFLWLNFDGGPVMDTIMKTVSGTAMWIPLYLLIIYLVWRKLGWQRTIGFVVCVALAIGFSDIISGIFKLSGPLGDLIRGSFQPRPRPLFTVELDLYTPLHRPDLTNGLEYYIERYGDKGVYGTVSGHAATTVALAWMSALAIRKNWYNWLIGIAVPLICYSRIYLAKHFPMDILLGAILGTVLGIAIFFLWKKFDKVIEKQIK
jgi:undecaprenyl-diphosphatase